LPIKKYINVYEQFITSYRTKENIMKNSTASALDNDFLESNEDLGIQELSTQRVKKAKAAYNVRNVSFDGAKFLLTENIKPNPGDLVLAKITAIGQHQRIELCNGRRSWLYIGDEIIVCYGSRYAPDQFEAYIPETLEPCHLVAAGGIASKSINRHSKMKRATQIQPLGILADAQGERFNINNWAISPIASKKPRPFTVAVLGTSMNAGKTTTAAGIIYSLKKQGLKVAAAKVTGTGAGGDRWKMVDAGADIILDFTDAGLTSTFGVSTQQLESTFHCLMDNLCAIEPDVIVLEVADGLYQKETAALMASDFFKASVDEIVFAAGEALGAKKGTVILDQEGYTVCAVSGAINASPLAKSEAENELDLPVLQPEAVGDLIHGLLQKNKNTSNVSSITSA